MGCCLSATLASTSEPPKSSAAPAAFQSSHMALEVALVDVALEPAFLPPPITGSSGSSARALFDYKAESEEELTLKADQLIEVNRDEMRFFALAHPPPTCAADHGEKRQWLVAWKIRWRRGS
jgi:hypothetical protein